MCKIIFTEIALIGLFIHETKENILANINVSLNKIIDFFLCYKHITTW